MGISSLRVQNQGVQGAGTIEELSPRGLNPEYPGL